MTPEEFIKSKTGKDTLTISEVAELMKEYTQAQHGEKEMRVFTNGIHEWAVVKEGNGWRFLYWL